MGPYSHTKFERNPPSRLRDLEKGCARAQRRADARSTSGEITEKRLC